MVAGLEQPVAPVVVEHATSLAASGHPSERESDGHGDDVEGAGAYAAAMAWWAVFGAVLAVTVPPTVPPTAPPSTPPVASTAPAGSVPASTLPGAGDPLGCTELVHDPSGELDVGAVTAVATQTAEVLGADVHVRAERDLDGGLDARMAQLEAQCPTWVSGTERAPDLVVVMYSSTEREASVFYGGAQSYALEYRWEHAVDEMGPRFADGDYTGGVVAGLDALREDAPVTYTPSYSPTEFADDDLSPPSQGVPPVVWLGLAALVLVAVVRVAQYMSTGEWDSGGADDDDDGGSSWSSSRRSSSRRSSSSSSRRSFSSSRSSGSRSRVVRTIRRGDEEVVTGSVGGDEDACRAAVVAR